MSSPRSPLPLVEVMEQGLPESLVLAPLFALAERWLLLGIIDPRFGSLRPKQQANGH